MSLRNSLGIAMLLLLAGAVVSAQESRDEEEKPASFAGMVVNGVTGEPVAHVHIYLNRNGKIAIPDYRAITGTDGRFSINAIKPGRYFLGGERRGYSSPGGSWFGGEENGPRAYTFDPGSEVRDVVVKLVPDSAIAGRVVDSNGVPMERVMVQTIGDADPVMVGTDDRGEFRIGGLHPGRYLVRALWDDDAPPEVRTDGSIPVNYGPTWFPSSAAAASAAPVVVQAGEDTGHIEIKMLPAPVLHISGQVSGATRGGSLGVRLSNGPRDRTCWVGADGKFTLWRVPPGRYLLLAESSSGGQPMRSAPVPINLTKTSIEGVRLSLEHAIDLTLKPERADLQQFKEEIGGFSVTLSPVDSLEHREEAASINPDHVFQLPETWPGRYRVLVKGLPDNTYVKSVRSDKREFPDGILELSGGPAKQEMVLELGTTGVEISGVVRDRKGGGVRGDHVALFFDDAFGYDLADTAGTADDGSFVFHTIAPGKYKILAYSSKNKIPQWSAEVLELYRDAIEKVEVNEGETKKLELKTISRE